MERDHHFWRIFGGWLAALSGVMLVTAALLAVSIAHRDYAEFRAEISAIMSADLSSAERQARLFRVTHARNARTSAAGSQTILLAGGLVLGLVMFVQSRKRLDARERNSAEYRARSDLARMPAVRYHTFWPRFWAGFLDGFAIAPISAASALLVSNTHGTAALAAQVAANAAFLGYSIYLLGTRGQTVGKWLCRVKVLDAKETPLRLRQAFWRDIGPIAISFAMLVALPLQWDPADSTYRRASAILAFAVLGWYLLELLTMLTNAKRRALHDFIAGSVVVRCAD